MMLEKKKKKTLTQLKHSSLLYMKAAAAWRPLQASELNSSCHDAAWRSSVQWLWSTWRLIWKQLRLRLPVWNSVRVTVFICNFTRNLTCKYSIFIITNIVFMYFFFNYKVFFFKLSNFQINYKWISSISSIYWLLVCWITNNQKNQTENNLIGLEKSISVDLYRTSSCFEDNSAWSKRCDFTPSLFKSLLETAEESNFTILCSLPVYN